MRALTSVPSVAIWEAAALAGLFAVFGFPGPALLAVAVITAASVFLGYVALCAFAGPIGADLHHVTTLGAFAGAVIGTVAAIAFAIVIGVGPEFSPLGTVVGLPLGIMNSAIWRSNGVLDRRISPQIAGTILVASILLLAGTAWALTWYWSEKQPLTAAIEQEDVRRVDELLAAGADPNAVSQYGDRALVLAAQYQNPHIVESLCSHGADVNGRSRDGFSALGTAAFGGRADIAEILLGHGADLNARNPDSWTPLMTAAQQGSLQTVRVLLQHGADVRVRDRDGQTALDLATQPGLVGDYPAIVSLLRQAGAKP